MVVVKPLFEAQQLAGLAHKLRTLILHIIRMSLSRVIRASLRAALHTTIETYRAIVQGVQQEPQLLHRADCFRRGPS